jgi:putative endonuclease
MNYFVYLLENNIGRHYIGITTDPIRRLAEHNCGNTKSTRPFRPWKIIYTEQFLTRQDACKREWHLKHPAGYLEKLDIIKKFGGIA